MCCVLKFHSPISNHTGIPKNLFVFLFPEGTAYNIQNLNAMYCFVQNEWSLMFEDRILKTFSHNSRVKKRTNIINRNDSWTTWHTEIGNTYDSFVGKYKIKTSLGRLWDTLM
jgi:hypothetical protein